MGQTIVFRGLPAFITFGGPQDQEDRLEATLLACGGLSGRP